MLHNGGVERWVVDLCRGAASEGLAMDIAVTDPTSGVFAARARENGISVRHCPVGSHPLVFVRNLRRLLRDQGPYDAVHCHIHAYSCFAVLAARLEGVPVRIAHSHNVIGNDSSPAWARRAYILTARVLLRWFATAGLAPSRVALEDLAGRGWRKDPRWGLLPYGIDLAPFRAPAGIESTRAALGIPERALVLGSVGRLTAEKNSEFLLDVLGAVLRSRGDAYLLLVGVGPLRDRLERKARESGFRDRLILAGVRKDVPVLLRDVVDVFVFPSPPPPRGNEALPIAVVEAQIAGVRSVLSEGVPEESILLSDLVLQVPTTAGPERWAESVLQQAARPESRGSAQSLRAIEQSSFNLTVCLKNLAALYRGVTPAPM